MNTFSYGLASRLYQPWQTTFDATSMSRQGFAGHVFWFGQLTDGNSITLDQVGTTITSLTISDGIDTYVSATLALPAAPLEAMLFSARFTNADWVAYLTSGNDTVVGTRVGDTLLGGAGNDTLLGGGGGDLLSGGAGSDLIDGGAGNDTASFADSQTAVHVDLLAGSATGQGSDTLVSIERIIGSAFDDSLAGGLAADLLNGGAGNDLLAGGAGDDTLLGGSGLDTVTYAGAATAVVVDLALGSALGDGTDLLKGIENVVGSAFDDRLAGTAGSNRIEGGAGNDSLNGGAGADVLAGGLGDDAIDGGGGDDTASYATAQYGVVADLALGTATGEGADTLVAIRNLLGSAQADSLTGDGGANDLAGGAGDDLLFGGDGNDTLAGGYGNDSLDGGGGIDTARFASATAAVAVDLAAGTAIGEGSDGLANVENVVGSDFADTLDGDGGANALDGGAGADRLAGRVGADRLTGGWGADLFVLTALEDSTVAAAGRDTVVDFSAAGGDRIDLGAIDADITQAGDQAFHLGGATFSGSAGELIQFVSGMSTFVMGDVDGNGSADFSLRLAGAPVLAGTAFVL